MSSPRKKYKDRPSSRWIDWPIAFRPRLSPRSREFVQNHPEQAQRVIAAALEAAAMQELRTEQFPQRSVRVPQALKRFIVRNETGEERLLSVSEAAEQLKVTRATIYAWVEAERLLAWRVTRRGLLIPAAQILGPGEVLPGMQRVLEVIPEPQVAWDFLCEELPFFDKPRRPIDVLKCGDVDAVVAAAYAYGEAFT